MSVEPELKQTPDRSWIFVAVLWAVVVTIAQGWGVFNVWEEPITHMKQAFGWGSTYPLENDIALVAIEEIPADRPWPWPHLDHAVLLRALLNYSPQSIVMDLPLYDQDTRYRVFDQTLGNVVTRFDKIAFSAQALTYKPDTRWPAQMPEIPYAGQNTAPSFTGALWPSDFFARDVSIGIGNLLLPQAASPNFVPMVFNMDGHLLPSLSLQAAALRLGASLQKSRVFFGREIKLRDAQGKLLRSIPIDEQGRMRLRLRPKWRPLWRDSFDNAILYSEQALRKERPFRSLSALRQKQIWIGRTDKKEIPGMWGLNVPATQTELRMQAAGNILAGDFIRDLPTFLLGFIYITASLGFATVASKFTTSQIISLGLFMVGLWTVLSGGLFMAFGYLLPMVSYSILIVGCVLISIALFPSSSRPSPEFGQ